MRRQGGDAHRHDRPLRGRKRPDRREELLGTRPVDDAEHGVPSLGQAKRTLAAVLGLLVTLDEPTTDQAVDTPAGGRGRPADRLGQLAHRQRAAVGQHVQGRQLGEPQPQLPELPGEADDEFAPEGPAHRHALTDLAHIGQPVAGRQDGRGEVGLELAGDRPPG